MRHHYRAIAVAVALGVATLVSAQTNNANNNPVARGPHGDTFFHNPLQGQRGQPFADAFSRSGIERPQVRRQPPVTPVPEPSQWAMMLAGLVLVGFIVRRNSKRN